MIENKQQNQAKDVLILSCFCLELTIVMAYHCGHTHLVYLHNVMHVATT